MAKTWAEAYVSAYRAQERCIANGNAEWQERWGETIRRLLQLLPSGSGFDSDPEVTITKNGTLSIVVPFHCMNDVGYYDGWETYKVTARPTFEGMVVNVRGPNVKGSRFGLADYVGEAYQGALSQEVSDGV